MQNLQNGNILIPGGSRRTCVGKEEIYNSCEVFDVQSEKWIKVADMNYACKNHTVTTLEDGCVLVTGGLTNNSGYLKMDTKSCEIYNPYTNIWKIVDSLSFYHFDHSALLLNNGKVLIYAGENRNGLTEICELYNTNIDEWNYAGGLTKSHPNHSSFQLSDSTILIVGGDNPHWEIFNLNQLQSTYVGISEIDWFLQSVLKLSNGKIVKIGGVIWMGMGIDPTNKCEIFDPNITSVKKNISPNIDGYQLFQNYPNPFNPNTNIRFYLKNDTYVKLVIYNNIGEIVEIIIDERRYSKSLCI